MTRWCQNNVSIRGRATNLDALWNAAIEGRQAYAAPVVVVGFLECLFPIPTCLDGTGVDRGAPYDGIALSQAPDALTLAAMEDANLEFERRAALAMDQCGYDSWPTWAQGVWGCVDSDVVSLLERRARSIQLRTDTPWHPPGNALIAISERFDVVVRNRWYSGRARGQGFAGLQVFSGGTTVTDVLEPYHGRRGGEAPEWLQGDDERPDVLMSAHLRSMSPTRAGVA